MANPAHRPTPTTLAVLILTGCQSSPGTIDFSGQWHLNTRQSQLESLSYLQRASLLIQHDDPHFELHRTFTIAGQESRVSFQISSDGRETMRIEGDRQLFSTMHWQGDALIFTTRIVDPSGEGTNTVTYHLSSDGLHLYANERFEGPFLSYRNRWVFDKR